MKYGLVGTHVENSFSKVIHEYVSDIEYELLSLESKEEFLDFLKTDFKAVSVTMPYKELAYENCDVLSDTAKATKVVNLIVKIDNKLYGFNTDIDGFRALLLKNYIQVKGKNCLILGTGASSRTVEYVLKVQGAKQIQFLSRHPDYEKSFPYKGFILSNIDLVINTTPVGKYPDINEEPLLQFSTTRNKISHYIDLIYSPAHTNTAIEAKEVGITCINGLYMLVYQALKAQELFLNKKFNEEDYIAAYHYALSKKQNIALIGHPMAGKTLIGQALSKKLNMKLIDIDVEINKIHPIIDIFKTKGEPEFRRLESEQIYRTLDLEGFIISTGGGVVLSDQNMRHLLKTSTVINIESDLTQTKESDFIARPVTPNIDKLLEIIGLRKALYKKYSDLWAINNGDIEESANKIRELL